MQRIVLYAEDDENDVFFMLRAFKRAALDCRLQIASDGRDAINYLAGAGAYADREKFPMPNLVLLDLSMPGASGLEVIEWVRSQASTQALPVIVFTSSNQEKDIQRAYSLGANGYLIKPGQPEELISMVNGIRRHWLA